MRQNDEPAQVRGQDDMNPEVERRPYPSASHRAMLNARLPEHSVNPCLVIGARNAALGGEPAAQGTEQPILLRIAEADIGQCCEVDRGARDSERTLSRARDIATLSRCSGIAVSVPPMKQWVHEPLGAVGEGGVDIIFS